MKEINFEELKALLKGEDDIEFVIGAKKPIRVRIRNKHYIIVGVKKSEIFEYLDSFPD